VSYGREKRKEGSSHAFRHVRTPCSRNEVMLRRRVHGEERSQIGLQNTKMHCIEILGPEEVIRDASRLDSSIFTCKERRAYFNVSLILNKGRHTLLMHVSVDLFSSLGMYTYMRMCLSLLDLRRIFKGSSLIYVSYLSFLHSGRISDFPSMHRARTSYMRVRLPLYEKGDTSAFIGKRKRVPSNVRLPLLV
jgi:hypothetical protein